MGREEQQDAVELVAFHMHSEGSQVVVAFRERFITGRIYFGRDNCAQFGSDKAQLLGIAVKKNLRQPADQDIGNFADVFAYNQAQLRDRDVADLYEETDEFVWRWDNETNRREFESMRVRSDRAANRADFSLAAIFLNHLISAIHSTLAVHKFNKRLAGERLGMKLNFDLDSRYQALTVNLAKHF